MGRAALLPTFSGDRDGLSRNPIVGMWMRFYQRWQHTVDQLLIDFNDDDHGLALARLVDKCEHEYIMFIEEDGIILKPEYVEQCFQWIESGEYDIVGSQRPSCNPEISEAAKQRWGLEYNPPGGRDPGPNFWPNFFFCKKSDLLKTDLNFSAGGWEPGEYIESLDYTVSTPHAIGGDTMVPMSLQLRALGLKIKYVNQYHSCPEDLEYAGSNKHIWDGECPWFHMGSLSGFFNKPTTVQESLELERRAMWHELCGTNIDDIISEFELDRGRIDQMKEIYRRIINV